MTVTPAPTRHPDEATVHRLLQERLLRGSEVLAGTAAMNRPVSWCHSLDDLVRDGVNDLTSVVVLAEAAELDDRRWAYLLKANCAAVFVRGAITVPPTVLARAHDELAVVRLPNSLSRTAVMQLIGMVSLAHRAHVLEYGQEVHSALANLLHRGGGLTSLCNRLAVVSHCAVAVLGQDLHLLAFDPGPGDHLEPAAVTTAFKAAQPNMASVTAASGPHAVVTLELTVGERPVICVAGPIDLVEHRDGWVLLFDSASDVTEHDLAEHRVALEQAVTIFGTELLRVRGLERVEERAKGNFVHALLHARFSNRADLVARAAHYDFDVDGRYGVVVAHSGGLVAQRDSPGKLTEMARAATSLPHVPDRQTMATVVGDVVAVIREIPAARRGHADPAAEELRDYAVAWERRLRERTHKEIIVAFGRPVVGADGIVESYREARIALDLRDRLHVEQVCGFSDLRVDSVLLDLAQHPGGQEYAAEILGPLQDDRDGGLAEVVRVYVAAGGNLNEAARRLNVHRNTMLYKLERIGRLVQRDVRAPDTQFAVWLAIRLDDLAATARRVNRDLMSG